MKAAHLQIGKLGEELATQFLKKQGFHIIDRNYLRKWGEIDIIAQKDRILHFIEVKTTQNGSRVTFDPVSQETKLSVTRENDHFRPEENVHPAKLRRLSRAIQTYLLDHTISRETLWQLDVLTVLLNTKTKKAQIEIIENVII